MVAGLFPFAVAYTFQMPDPAPPHRYMVAAAIKDEGPFLVEWVCWYRMLGFDQILICSNDCTDRSVPLLEALQKAGWLCHAPHQPVPGKPAKRSAHRTIRAHPLTAKTAWLMICDIDEFLVIHKGDGLISDLVGNGPPTCLGMGIHWRCFGTSGHETWQDGLVHRMFTQAAAHEHMANTSFKSIFRNPTAFTRFGAHSPRNYAGVFGTRPDVWIDSSGERLWRFHPNENPQRATAPGRVRHADAQLNHYMVRARESFELKRGTLSASANADRYTDAFFERYNRNEQPDSSAQRYTTEFDVTYRAAMALPDVRRLHHLCCADYVARLAADRGVDPEGDPRYHYHLKASTS